MDGNDSVDEMFNTVFSLGDLIWTKIGKYPFWPAMVSYDPHDSCFLKLVKSKSKQRDGKELAIYHVQYFGNAVLRGWTSPGNSFRFNGMKDYLEKIQKFLAEKALVLGSKSMKKWKEKFYMPKKAINNWMVAVKEAEEALKIKNPTERFETFVFSYETGKRKSTISKDQLVKQKNSLSNGIATPISSSSDTFDESAHSSKRICMSDECVEVCNICGKNNAVFPCTGVCSKFFHMECLGFAQVQENFKCPKCSSDLSSELSNLYSCFACHKSNGSMRVCSKCSKFYHAECFAQYECANIDKNICPLHACLTCYRENPRNIMSRKGHMVRCVQCPTAFHDKISCIAAGSVMKTSSTIVCPYHFHGTQRISHLAPCNFNHCSECSLGGELVCCEACPRAFHINCLKTSVPNEDFLCEDCMNRQFLLYGMVIWGKMGHYRWWPAQIIHSSQLPDKMMNLKHYDGEFAVRFFGTYDYTWTHSGRVFPYTEEHRKFKVTRCNSEKYREKYKIGLLEAAVAFKQYQDSRHSDSDVDKQPEVYKHIKVSRALPPAQIITDLSNILTCSCNPSEENPCGPESQCLNRSMLMECHPDFCLAKDLCQNQKFQKRQYVSTKVFKTENRGWGLKTLQDVKKGEFIIEYVGEIITHEEFRRRSGEMLGNGYSNYYFLYLDARRMIDAGPMGNYSRFINHSCDPNCEMRKWSVNGDARIGIFAVADISTDQELTFNYQSDKHEFEQKCYCSSKNCRGFIGRNTKNAVKPTGTTRKGFSFKKPSKIPASKKKPMKSKMATGKKRNKSALNSKKYSKLSSSSTSANSSSPPASPSHIGCAVSAEMKKRLSRLIAECCVCKSKKT